MARIFYWECLATNEVQEGSGSFVTAGTDHPHKQQWYHPSRQRGMCHISKMALDEHFGRLDLGPVNGLCDQGHFRMSHFLLSCEKSRGPSRYHGSGNDPKQFFTLS